MARSKNRLSAHTCPRCAALLTLGASHCGLCQLDLTAPIAPVIELVPATAVVESVVEPVVAPVVAPAAEPIHDTNVDVEPPAGYVLVGDVVHDGPQVPPTQPEPIQARAVVAEPADDEYTSTSVFLPLPHDLPAVSAAIANEPTPLAPVELLSDDRSVDFALFNPRDPFSWYPVVQA
ncbi:MAG: hypothetical protein NTU50_02800 [Actinobacteria bacterium]|nr:hypothetical protein [Actinomycetota bacterium]